MDVVAPPRCASSHRATAAIGDEQGLVHAGKAAREPVGAAKSSAASARCAIGLISSYATGTGANIAICDEIRVEIDPTAAATLHSAGESARLIAATVDVMGLPVRARFWGSVVDPSPVPSHAGLKTSSAFTTAIVMAAAGAAGVSLPDEDLVHASTQVQRLCGLTSAGSVDDTWSALVGGIVIANSATKRLVMRQAPPTGVRAVILIPHGEQPVAHRIDRRVAMRPHASRIAALLDRLAAGDVFGAATEAAFVQSRALGYSCSPLSIALAAGAYGVAQSGKGPARAAFSDAAGCLRVARAWRIAYPLATVISTIPVAQGASGACRSRLPAESARPS